MPENGSLLIFACAREPGVAAKRSAIEFAHSGRTLDRKEGSSHSFWSHCLATGLRQSNRPVARLPAPAPASSGGPGAGEEGGCLLRAFTLFSLHSNHIFSRLRASGSRFPALGIFPGEKESGKGGGRVAPGGTWDGAAQSCFWTVTGRRGSTGANGRSH